MVGITAIVVGDGLVTMSCQLNVAI